MPYCAKCGVEVDSHEKTCPLCDFPIPDLKDKTGEHVNDAFPEGQNRYKEQAKVIKNKILFVLVSLAILTLPILFSIRIYYPQVALGMSYAMISVIVAPFYLYFILGYLGIYYNIIGIGITSLFFTFVLDHIKMPATWFYRYAVFMVLWLMVLTCLFIFLYRKSKYKNQLIYVPTYIIGSIGLLSVGIDGLIVYRIYESIHLTWSIVVLMSSFAICLLLLGLYHGLPRHIKSSIKRKFHV